MGVIDGVSGIGHAAMGAAGMREDEKHDSVAVQLRDGAIDRASQAGGDRPGHMTPLDRLIESPSPLDRFIDPGNKPAQPR